jgi:hypothetical protein
VPAMLQTFVEKSLDCLSEENANAKCMAARGKYLIILGFTIIKQKKTKKILDVC